MILNGDKSKGELKAELDISNDNFQTFIWVQWVKNWTKKIKNLQVHF